MVEAAQTPAGASGVVKTLEDVMHDCVRSRKGGEGDDPRIHGAYVATQKKLFVQCWEALNQWALFRMKKRQAS